MRRGSSLVEYLGAIAAVALVLGTLLTLREHEVSRRAPIDPVAEIARLLGSPAQPRQPRVRPPTTTPTTPTRPRKRRPPAPRVVIEVPGWAIGP